MNRFYLRLSIGEEPGRCGDAAGGRDSLQPGRQVPPAGKAAALKATTSAGRCASRRQPEINIQVFSAQLQTFEDLLTCGRLKPVDQAMVSSSVRTYPEDAPPESTPRSDLLHFFRVSLSLPRASALWNGATCWPRKSTSSGRGETQKAATSTPNGEPPPPERHRVLSGS